jgi:hypothetical protein
MNFQFDESARQVILLSLAHMAVERPGWKFMLGGVAARLDDGDLFYKFYEGRLKRVSNSLPDCPTDESFKNAIMGKDKNEDRTQMCRAVA